MSEQTNTHISKSTYGPLITPKEISEIFSSGWLYDQNSFYFIDRSTKNYDEARDKTNFIKESKLLYEKYQTGHTLIIKNLESCNEVIKQRAKNLGDNTDVHMYLVPPNGKDSFNFHQDDRDVIVHLVSGQKTFYLKDGDHEKEYKLKPGDELFIKKETWHKAVPDGPSCLLSFGSCEFANYLVPTQFKAKDFCY